MKSGYGNLVLMEKGDGIARITLNRQEKRNAFTRGMIDEILAALRGSWECSVVTISGGDGPGFCSGIDMGEARPPEHERNYNDFRDSWAQMLYLIWEHPAVCVASVNGFALAGGLALVNTCDLAVASEKAQFGMPEMGFGFPGLSAPMAAKLIHKKHLAQLVFTVERINAETAFRMGLVNYVVPHDQLAAKTEEVARRIAQIDSARLEQAKKTVNLLPELDWTTAHRFGGTIGSAVRNATGAEDSRSGFLEGRRGLGQGAEAQ